MDRGRLLGGVLGLVTLGVIFALPFSNIAEGPGGPADTLFGIFHLFVVTFSNIQAVGLTQLSELAYVYFIVLALIALAGMLGVYPLWSGVLGIVGMALVTLSPYLIFSQYSFSSTIYGVGYWAVWAASILAIIAAYWSRREKMHRKSLGWSPTSTSGKTPLPGN
ncbi:MAG: hypothetical protein OK452_02325 [Thaumarchaeota archaeon]|nr:hypothetical protein [Nitrososphaerota archaeon]